MRRTGRVGDDWDDDDLLDDGWVQRDEEKERINRRLKRTGYNNWRKSLDAATRYELEKTKTVSIEVDDDYHSFLKRREASSSSSSSPSSSFSSSTSLISSRDSSIISLPQGDPSPTCPSPSSDPSSSSTSSSTLSSSKSTSAWVGVRSTTGGREQRRSIGVMRSKELEHALEREAVAAGHDDALRREDDAKQPTEEKVQEQDKKQQKKETKDKKRKGGSGLLFWKRGKGEKSEGEEDADADATKTKTTAHTPTARRHDENVAPEEERPGQAAVLERERSGTLALYAAMSSGYRKQHDALAQ